MARDFSRRSDEPELMDADDLAPDTYAAVVADLARVNRVTLAARPTLAFLRRTCRPGGRYRLLDARDGWNYLATPITASGSTR